MDLPLLCSRKPWDSQSFKYQHFTSSWSSPSLTLDTSIWRNDEHAKTWRSNAGKGAWRLGVTSALVSSTLETSDSYRYWYLYCAGEYCSETLANSTLALYLQDYKGKSFRVGELDVQAVFKDGHTRFWHVHLIASSKALWWSIIGWSGDLSVERWALTDTIDMSSWLWYDFFEDIDNETNREGSSWYITDDQLLSLAVSSAVILPGSRRVKVGARLSSPWTIDFTLIIITHTSTLLPNPIHLQYVNMIHVRDRSLLFFVAVRPTLAVWYILLESDILIQ